VEDRSPEPDAERLGKPFYLSDLSSGRVLSRQRHLELLVFEVIALLDADYFTAETMESSTYESMRMLLKSLVRERRPDGTSYR